MITMSNPDFITHLRTNVGAWFCFTCNRLVIRPASPTDHEIDWILRPPSDPSLN